MWNDCCQLQVYNLDTFAFVESLTITPGLPGEIQGGAFYRGDLYICTNAQDGIWKIDLTKKTSEFVLSDAYDNHEYEVNFKLIFKLEDNDTCPRNVCCIREQVSTLPLRPIS